MKTTEAHTDPLPIEQAEAAFREIVSVTTQAASASAVALRLLKPKGRREKAEFDRKIRRCISRTPPEKEFLRLFLRQMLG